MALGLVACDQAPPPRSSLLGWPPGEPIEIGGCRFVLGKADMWHSTEWHLEVEVSVEGIGAETTYCSFSLRAMTSSDSPLTTAATGSGKLGSGEVRPFQGQAREVDETGMSTGAAEGAWVYAELAEGRWPLATTRGVTVSPGRVRPP